MFAVPLVVFLSNQRVRCFVLSPPPQQRLSLNNAVRSNPTTRSRQFLANGDDDDSLQKHNISLLIIDHYDSFTYNLYDMLAQLTVEPPQVVAKDAFDGWDPQLWSDIDGIILSPGPGSPQDQPAFSKESIRCNPHLPILGVCLGHQLLALEYGATVDKAPIPIHGQDHWINNEQKSVFQGLPTSFRAVRYHSLAATDLPKEELQVIATSSDGVIQGIQHRKYPHYGVQFHPESIGTQHGMELLDNFCRIVQDKKRKHMGEQSTVAASEPSKEPSKDADLTSTNQEAPRPRFQVFLHPVSSVEDESLLEPVDAFEKILGLEPHAIWLDSSSAPISGRGTVDIMAAPSSSSDIIEYYLHHNTTDILTQLQNALFQDSSDQQNLNIVESDFSSFKVVKDQANLTWPPFDYRGGYLGFLGYDVRHDTQQFLQQLEYCQEISPSQIAPNGPPSTIPDSAFFLARQSMVYHHPSQTWYLIGLVEEDNEIKGILEWMAKTAKALIQTPSSTGVAEVQRENGKIGRHPISFVPNRSKGTYEKDIAKCHEFIELGESYELCLTNQLEASTPKPLSTWDLYRQLRFRNPTPYSSYFRWNIDALSKFSTPSASFAICSSSPERFMSVKRKRFHPLGPMSLQAEAKPIKGTCARVQPQNGVCLSESELREDQRRARSLEISLKNRAENLMIVDLLRNDMSRVCQVGSVHVAKLMAIESFATVHQMVSTIRGTLPEQTTPIDLLRASFPGGSMTGAPKISTMELLVELEGNVSRGPYSGSLGYLSVNGCMDMNIIIRSAVVTPDENGGRKISIGAGGAITALSEAEDEYEEMLLKARAVVQSVQEWEAMSPTPAIEWEVESVDLKDIPLGPELPISNDN